MKINGVIKTTIQAIPWAYDRTTTEIIRDHQLIITFTGTETECKIMEDRIFSGKLKKEKNSVKRFN